MCIPVRGCREGNRQSLALHPSIEFGPSGDWWGTRLERLLAIIGRCRTWNYLRDGSKGVNSVGMRCYPLALFFFESFFYQVCIRITEVDGGRVPRIVDDGLLFVGGDV